MYPEHGFLLLILAIGAFLFVRAFNYGVAGMLWAVTGVVAGIIGGWIFYGMIPDLFPDWEAGFRTRLFLSALIGVVPYLIVRFAAKAAFTWLFNTDGPLGYFADGIPGGILSLIPTLVIVIVLTICARIGGTWADLRRYEKLSVPNAHYLEINYPGRPILTMWRDGVERLPLVLETFDLFDSLDRVPERNLVALLITTKKEELLNHLSGDPETRGVIVSDAFAELLADPEITQLNQDREHIALIQHEAIRTAAIDPQIRPILEEMELHRVVDEFLLSPGHQNLIRSFDHRETNE